MVRQAAEEDGVGYGIKGCRKVQEDENADEAGIRNNEEVIRDFNEGSLCQDFAEERKVGDRPVVGQVLGQGTSQAS